MAATAVYALVKEPAVARRNLEEVAAAETLLINWPGPSQQASHYSLHRCPGRRGSGKHFY